MSTMGKLKKGFKAAVEPLKQLAHKVRRSQSPNARHNTSTRESSCHIPNRVVHLPEVTTQEEIVVETNSRFSFRSHRNTTFVLIPRRTSSLPQNIEIRVSPIDTELSPTLSQSVAKLEPLPSNLKLQGNQDSESSTEPSCAPELVSGDSRTLIGQTLPEQEIEPAWTTALSSQIGTKANARSIVGQQLEDIIGSLSEQPSAYIRDLGDFFPSLQASLTTPAYLTPLPQNSTAGDFDGDTYIATSSEASEASTASESSAADFRGATDRKTNPTFRHLQLPSSVGSSRQLFTTGHNSSKTTILSVNKLARYAVRAEQDIKDLSKNVAELEEERRVGRLALEFLYSRNKDLDSDIDRVLDAYRNLGEKLAQWQEFAHQRDALCAQQVEEYNDLMARFEVVGRAYAAEAQERHELVTEVQKLKGQLVTNEGALTKLQGQTDLANNKLFLSVAEKAKLKKQNGTLKEDLEFAKEESERWERHCKEAEEEVSEKEQEIAALKKQLRDKHIAQGSDSNQDDDDDQDSDDDEISPGADNDCNFLFDQKDRSDPSHFSDDSSSDKQDSPEGTSRSGSGEVDFSDRAGLQGLYGTLSSQQHEVAEIKKQLVSSKDGNTFLFNRHMALNQDYGILKQETERLSELLAKAQQHNENILQSRRLGFIKIDDEPQEESHLCAPNKVRDLEACNDHLTQQANIQWKEILDLNAMAVVQRDETLEQKSLISYLKAENAALLDCKRLADIVASTNTNGTRNVFAAPACAHLDELVQINREYHQFKKHSFRSHLELDQTYETLQRDYEKLNRTVVEIHNEYEADRDQNTMLRDANAKLQDHVRSLGAMIADECLPFSTQSQREQFDDTVDNLQDKLSTYRRIVDEKEEYISSLSWDLCLAKGVNGELVERLDSLQAAKMRCDAVVEALERRFGVELIWNKCVINLTAQEAELRRETNQNTADRMSSTKGIELQVDELRRLDTRFYTTTDGRITTTPLPEYMM